ncbi:uncharacterized protein LOC133821977 [Humulus lupulus]|uniref:uncharacterized protein LOC133821977 n=1 Tax=Humulus lupulus TaxID=3486 RepID=UPI002B4090CE|nr:uncharacterized protein LOC133821977 [Humulus lupulus]
MGSLYLNMFRGWCFTTNLMQHPNGRIVVAWNPLSYDVDIRGSSSQWMHFAVSAKNGVQLAITVVYAFNDKSGRKRLWEDLENMAHSITDPWIVMGDFNAILSPEDRFPYHGNGSELIPFQHCVEYCRLIDMKFSGTFFTWNNKQGGKDRVYAKLDRVLANESWIGKFQTAEVIFFPEGSMDHSPFMVNFGSLPENKKPFKFFNFWCNLEGFHRTVAECWRKEVQGTPMYCLITKLKRLRVELKKLNREGKEDVFMQEATKNKLMLEIQDQLQSDPGNNQLIKEEIARRKEYQSAHKNLVQFLKQKVKEDWLKHGDENTKLFHNSIRHRHT